MGAQRLFRMIGKAGESVEKHHEIVAGGKECEGDAHSDSCLDQVAEPDEKERAGYRVIICGVEIPAENADETEDTTRDDREKVSCFFADK